jgi:hypothetical protein
MAPDRERCERPQPGTFGVRGNGARGIGAGHDDAAWLLARQRERDPLDLQERSQHHIVPAGA